MKIAKTRREAERARMARALREESTGFSFFQAVRLLTRLGAGRAPVGGWADPADEVVRFGSSTSLAFPASEVQSLAEDDADASMPPRMTVNFLGLVGPVGVLPHLYTEHASSRARAKDTAFRDFLDIFHHRITSLFYRAWAKYKPAVVQETRDPDRFQDHLLDLAGLGTPGLRARQPIPDAALAFYAGLLASGTRPADGLARIVGDYFDVTATVEQFVGEWRSVQLGGQCALGSDGDAGRLGWSVLGDEAWDPEGRVRLRLGPLTRAQYEAFLPGGSGHSALESLARLYTDDAVGVDVQLVLARDEVPRCILGSDGGASMGSIGAPALGRATWLSSRPLLRDPDETILRLS
jgi:type VI secretion system protein ImpH